MCTTKRSFIETYLKKTADKNEQNGMATKLFTNDILSNVLNKDKQVAENGWNKKSEKNSKKNRIASGPVKALASDAFVTCRHRLQD